MSAVEEPRRPRGWLQNLLPVAILAVIGGAFYLGLFNNDDRLPSMLISNSEPLRRPLESAHYARIGADRNGRVSIGRVVYGLPETFVIDAEGGMAYKHIGHFNRRSLEEDILPVVRHLQGGAG